VLFDSHRSDAPPGSLTPPEAAAMADRPFDAYASTNRTCELGMARATGHQYRHLIEVLEDTIAGSTPALGTSVSTKRRTRR
jgi:hypothetical protein